VTGETACAAGAREHHGRPARKRGGSSSDPMKRLAAVLVIGLTAGGQAPAADSVVIGHGISNSFFSDAPCAPDLICMEARYLWILDVRRTVSGPGVVGRIRVVASQQADANETSAWSGR
jgi:hypothetical protein